MSFLPKVLDGWIISRRKTGSLKYCSMRLDSLGTMNRLHKRIQPLPILLLMRKALPPMICRASASAMRKGRRKGTTHQAPLPLLWRIDVKYIFVRDVRFCILPSCTTCINLMAWEINSVYWSLWTEQVVFWNLLIKTNQVCIVLSGP